MRNRATLHSTAQRITPLFSAAHILIKTTSRRGLSTPPARRVFYVREVDAVKIIHVDMNGFALYEMEKEIPQIVPEVELHCFNHPEPALAFAEAEGCDVLLTEIELWSEPLGGIRLAERIKEINPRVQIIFVTVWDENEVARELSGLPISGFLLKPWTPEKLAATFQNLCCSVNPNTAM